MANVYPSGNFAINYQNTEKLKKYFALWKGDKYDQKVVYLVFRAKNIVISPVSSSISTIDHTIGHAKRDISRHMSQL